MAVENNEVRILGIRPAHNTDDFPVSQADKDLLKMTIHLMAYHQPTTTWKKVLCDLNGKLIVDPTAILENPPVEDNASKAATSEWCYDHWKLANAHHAKYTDAEARTAIYGSKPCFSSQVSTIQDDVTGDGTTYNLTGAFWTEILDQGGNFSDGTFTAPVNGVYLLSGVIALRGVAAAHSYGYANLVTSNRIYTVFQSNPGALQGNTYLFIFFAVYADMDEADTSYLQVRIFYGTKVIDIFTNTIFGGSRII